jgi:hypothetical protein
MRRRYVQLVLAAVAAAVLAVSAAGSSPAATTHARASTCRAASTARGSKIVTRDSAAVVFRRHGSSVLRGCAYGHSVRKLSEICCDGERISLGGRFLAYTYVGTAIGDETNKLGVINLVSGRLEKIAKMDPHGEGGGREIETSSFVPAFAVTSRGALVWVQDVLTSFDDPHCSRCETGQSELRAGDGRPPSERVVDSGKIDGKSLRITRDEQAIVYRKDGHQHRAALRR